MPFHKMTTSSCIAISANGYVFLFSSVLVVFFFFVFFKNNVIINLQKTSDIAYFTSFGLICYFPKLI